MDEEVDEDEEETDEFMLLLLVKSMEFMPRLLLVL